MKRLKQFAIIGAIILAALTPVIGTRAAPAPVPVNPGTTGLVSWWSLDETSGIRYDSHGSNNLSETGSVWYVAGKRGNGASFSATTNLYRSATTGGLARIDKTPFTFGYWLYPTASQMTIGSGGHFIGAYDVGVSWLTFMYSGCTYFRMTTDGIYANGPQAQICTIPLNQWSFIVAWYDGANLFIQGNDGVIGSRAFAGTPYSRSDFRLGTNEFSGRIDEAFFYNRQLTADERAWLYNNGAGRSYSEVNPPPTATPTATALPPTNTPLPPTATATALPPTPTATALPPTNTPLPPTPTATALPPTNTPLPPTPTDTSLPPTNTPLPPTATATALPPTNTPLPPTPTDTSLPPTNTATPDPAATSTPLPLPTMRWEPSISYGEYAIVGSNMVLILLFVVGGMIAFVLTVVEKRRRP